MAQGKLVKIYECSCTKCGKVETLFKTLKGSQKHLRMLGWCENKSHDWYCKECRPAMPRRIHVTYPPDQIHRLFEFTEDRCYTNEDNG